ncbi:DUF4843 domain-containing protein [Butyricimonas virosa]|uniref:DUF4843 domain-containing protein n=1 Tax=Butyricimonas virosa TaxID=544645 RepID=A0A412X3I0_9BACT|nr:DUF4843 domain-containing protein [Butyricimonas virosa]RGV35142.1 DUF4843 domain-containing protein [Butyricimonas virosa]
MKNWIYTAIFCLTVALGACSEEEAELWTEKGFVWFSAENTDFSFKQLPDVGYGQTALAALPFTVATTMENRDRTVNVEVIRQPKDSRTKYEIQTPVVLHANRTSDTLWVRVTNSEHLETTPDTVGFRLIASEDFIPGLQDSITTNLCLYNGYVRPAWWDSSAERQIGYFTQLKMDVFVKVTGGTEDPRGDGSWSSSNIALTYLKFQLNDYIEANDIRYPANDPNAPGQHPVFASRKY